MIRFLLRSFSLACLAGAFVALVIDGTRSIAASGLSFTTLGMLFDVIAPGNIAAWRGPLMQIHPLLWDPLILQVLKTPAFLLLLAAGLALAFLSRPPEPLIGTSSRA